MIDSEYQKAINRQGSKKLIQGSYIMSGQSQNLFMQNKLNFKNAGMKFQGGGVQPGGYEYDIDLPKKEDAGSNQGVSHRALLREGQLCEEVTAQAQ